VSEGIGVDIDVIEELVRRALGGGVVVGAVRQTRPWSVARCDLTGADGRASVIVKWRRSNPEGIRVERRLMATEVAALQLVNAAASDVAPTLLAHDLTRDVLVVEDLAPRRTLHSVLSNGLTPTGVAGLHTFAETIARVHATTASTESPGSAWDQTWRVPIARIDALELLDRLGELASTSQQARSELTAALDEIDGPGDLTAFSNGDSGANNCMVDSRGGDGRLIDFEHACWRHALLDVAALHVPGPMWRTIADGSSLGLDDTYRRVAGVALPAVHDDRRYGHGLAAACATSALGRLHRIDVLDAREPGHHSRPQMVSTIERAARTMQHWSQLPALADWLDELAVALRSRWPDADVDLDDDYTLREPFDPDH
jgi:hypothetical protein